MSCPTIDSAAQWYATCCSNVCMISEKDGRRLGSRAQQDWISRAKKRGHERGITGRRSWLSTPSATWICVMPSYGHCPVKISHTTMPNENTSAFSVYLQFPSTSGLYCHTQKSNKKRHTSECCRFKSHQQKTLQKRQVTQRTPSTAPCRSCLSWSESVP